MSIICHGVEFKLHRNIVCSGSPMLNAAFNGKFQVTISMRSVQHPELMICEKEAQTQRIDFPKQIPSILSRVILYLYTGEFNPSEVPEAFQELCADPDEWTPRGFGDETIDDEIDQGDIEEELNQDRPPHETDHCVEDDDGMDYLQHAHLLKSAKISAMVYQSADMLMIDGLKLLAADHFLAYARQNYDNRDFHEALQTMYDSTSELDEDLRLPITKMLFRHRHTSLPDEVIQVARDNSAGWWDFAAQMLSDAEEKMAKMLGEHKSQVSNQEIHYTNLARNQADRFVKGFNEGDKLRCKHRKGVKCQVIRAQSYEGSSRFSVFILFNCERCGNSIH